MSRTVAIALFLFAVLTLCSSCMDQEPAEMSVQTTQGGQPLNCTVQVFNDKGVQVQEVFTERGFVYVKNLAPGTYFLKIKGRDEAGTLYPAMRKVSLSPGDNHVEQVDVDDASKNPADMPAG